MTSRKWFGPVLLFLLLGGSLLFHYSETIFNPNGVWFSSDGDGLKNYYTPWYHVKHDSSYTWFEGMNYPYGEHPSFTDAQPLVSNALKFVNDNIVDISDSVPGILNLLMILNLLVTGWFLFLIFRKLKVEDWYAAIAATAITLMSPQLLKLLGHYALAYSCFVPMLWYLLIDFFERPSWLRSVLILTLLFLFAWIHPYYLMLGFLFLGAAWGIHFLRFRKRHPLSFYLMHFGVQVLLPLILFKLTLSISDPVTDRPQYPFGFDVFHSTWKLVFLPTSIPGMEWSRAGMTDGEISWEGSGYVGFVGGLAFLFFWGRIIWWAIRYRGVELTGSFFNRITGRFRRLWRPSLNPWLAISVLSGLLILIFAMGFPFAQYPSLTEFFPPIKQFRSLGRFVWAFYYTWTVFAFYLVYLGYRHQKMKGRSVRGWVLAILALVVFMAEATAYNVGRAGDAHFGKIVEFQDGPEADKANAWLDAVNPEEYSALLVLPYFHYGSENIAAHNPRSSRKAFIASIQTGLPMMNAMQSRTSLEQTWKLIQFSLWPYHEIEILADLKDPRPLLVMEVGATTPNYKDGRRLRSDKPFYDKDGIKLSRMSREDLRKLATPNTITRSQVPDTLYRFAPNLYSTKKDPVLLLKSFDENASEFAYMGQGSMDIPLRNNNYLYNAPLDSKAGHLIKVSFWARVREDRKPLTKFGIEQQPADDPGEWTYPSLENFALAMDGEWMMTERTFSLTRPDKTIKINVTGWVKEPEKIEIDEFLMRTNGTSLYDFRTNGWLGINNLFYQTEEVRDSMLTGAVILDWK